MSKAFTKEDDETGFTIPSPVLTVPPGPFRLTYTGGVEGASHEDPRVREAVARAELLPRVESPSRVALGVTVRVRNEDDDEKAYRLVSAEEVALLGASHRGALASVEAPIGRALLGARIGDVREIVLPRGREELEVVALEGEPVMAKELPPL